MLNRFLIFLILLYLFSAQILVAQAKEVVSDKAADQNAGITPPKLISAKQPTYPKAAEKLHIEADIPMILTINSFGYVTRAEIVSLRENTEKISTPILKEFYWQALGAAANFYFKPAVKNGENIAIRVQYSVKFKQSQQNYSEIEDEVVTLDLKKEAVKSSDNILTTYKGPLNSAQGQVFKAGTVKIIAGAELYIFELKKKKGQWLKQKKWIWTGSTDHLGHFKVMLPPGKYVLELSSNGYQSHNEVLALLNNDDSYLRIYLDSELGDAFQTIVKERKQKGDVSKITLSRDELKGIPGTMGDALRVIESLPGVARSPFLGGALVVRGGLPGDTQVFMDGVPIPVLFHFGGLSSVVNSAFLSGIDFYPGGFSSRFGRATAGVVDVRSHELNFDNFEGQMDVDFMDMGFFFGGPIDLKSIDFGDYYKIPVPRFDFAFGARRSYVEIPAFMAIQASTGLSSLAPEIPSLESLPIPIPVYSDFQFKLESQLNKQHRLSFFAFGSEDQFVVLGQQQDLLRGTQDGFDSSTDPSLDFSIDGLLNTMLGNFFWRSVGEWKWTPTPYIRHRFKPWFGKTSKGLLANGLLVQAFTKLPLTPPEETWDWGLRDELEINVFDWMELTFGLDMIGQTVNTFLGEPFAPKQEPCSDEAAEKGECVQAFLTGYDIEGSFWSTAFYMNSSIGPFKGLTIYPGLRLHWAGMFFDEKRNEVPYAQKRNSYLRSFWNVDPRISARYEVVKGFTLKTAVGSYRQPPNLQSVALQINEPLIRQPRAIHAVVGFEAKIGEYLNFESQVYTVKRDLQTRDAARAWDKSSGLLDGVFITQPQNLDDKGEGQTYGFEFFLRHMPSEYFFGWIAYTYSRTWLNVGEEVDPYHPAPFDSTHNLILVGKVNLPWKLVFGTRFQYATGGPSPIHDNLLVINNLNSPYNNYTPISSTLRRPRLPDYHRLDFRLDRRFVFDSFSLMPYAEVINSYVFPNVEVSGPDSDFRGRGTRPWIPGIPLFISLGVNAEF